MRVVHFDPGNTAARNYRSTGGKSSGKKVRNGGTAFAMTAGLFATRNTGDEKAEGINFVEINGRNQLVPALRRFV